LFVTGGLYVLPIAVEDGRPSSSRQLEERIEARMEARFASVDARFDQVDLRFSETETRLQSRFDQALREQTRTLMLGTVGALFTMTSVCLGAIALAV